MTAVAVFSAVAVCLGVVVTGAGPHAGDANAPRNDLDWDLFAHIHAVPAYLVTAGALFGLFLVVRGGSPARSARRCYAAGRHRPAGCHRLRADYTGIPALLVGAHMLAAALLMSAATNAADLARYSPVK